VAVRAASWCPTWLSDCHERSTGATKPLQVGAFLAARDGVRREYRTVARLERNRDGAGSG
jgi:hypothetical protein